MAPNAPPADLPSMLTAQPRPPAIQSCRVDFVSSLHLDSVLDDPTTLAVFRFGASTRNPSLPPLHPRLVDLSLGHTHGLEVWRCSGPVRHGVNGALRWSTDGHLSFGAIELAESADAQGDIEQVAQRAYRMMLDHVQSGATPHLLRIWNFLQDIVDGEGDSERYRRFCLGRAQGLEGFADAMLPAATGIGRYDHQPVFQLSWISAAEEGRPVENPRQVSAYHYPRQYGPRSPSFARAMLPPRRVEMPLLVSGTASIIGHESQHVDSLEGQIGETLANIQALIDEARRCRPQLPPTLDDRSRLRVYVRDAEAVPAVVRLLDAKLPPRVHRFVLHAEICRRELMVEIEGVHGVGPRYIA